VEYAISWQVKFGYLAGVSFSGFAFCTPLMIGREFGSFGVNPST